MRIILSGIHSLEYHILYLSISPDIYRPKQCPHCGRAGLWNHGSYERQSDRENPVIKSLNPILIPRFKCSKCSGTCSVLPQCIPPRRWYLWLTQQAILTFVIADGGLRTASNKYGMYRSTIRRWIHRFKQQFLLHCDALKGENSELGRRSGFADFWQHYLQDATLSQAMIVVQKNGIHIP